MQLLSMNVFTLNDLVLFLINKNVLCNIILILIYRLFVKGHKVVLKPRKKKIVSKTLPKIAPKKPIDFGIDLETPPHQFNPKVDDNCNHSSENPVLVGSIGAQQNGNDFLEDADLNDLPEECAAKKFKLCEPVTSVNAGQHCENENGHKTAGNVQSSKLTYSVECVEAEKDDDLSGDTDLDGPHKRTSARFTENCGYEHGAPCETEDVQTDGKKRTISDKLSENLEIEQSASSSRSQVNGDTSVTDGEERVDDQDGRKITILRIEALSPNRSYRTFTDVDSNEDTSSLTCLPKESDGLVEAINIEALVKGGNPVWEEIISKYELYGSLSKKNRKSVNEAIVQFARVKDIYMDISVMESVSYQICKLFPTEATTNYIMHNGKGYSGSLYNLYHRKRSNDIKEKKELLRDELVEADFDVLEPTESINMLKCDGHDDDVYIDNWKMSFDYRQKKMSEYDSFDDFIHEWPIIKKEIGMSLINLDFIKIHGNRAVPSNNWNLFFSNNWKYIVSSINAKGQCFANKVHKLKESSAKDAALSLVLHYLLPPAFAVGQWKPTYKDSQDTFLKFIKNESMEAVINARNETCMNRGIKWHPYIIGQGRSARKIKTFIVVIHDTQIPCEDFLTALQYCLYLFILLDIPYPPESKAVWLLVNRLFLNVKVESLLTSRICQLINDLK
ncbi:uncharacterized protein LOC119072133 [Bradysia coprophila]|uniref:uncharacterized protein LOC119072133 n=1 Tax=Bradysia coprophila TaxID=38358 RepID=UPI00187DB8A2|nr:uncharacterized protein LOC119072133 [Bradysia coprophila]